MSTRTNRREGGYTLAEAAVVLAIASIALAIAIPAMSSFMRAYSARVGADEFISHLRLARHLAIARHTDVSVTVNQLDYSMPDWAAQDITTAQLRDFNLPGACQIVSGTGTVTFRPDGTVSAGAGNIRLEIALDNSYTARYDVTVSVSGQITHVYTQVQS